LSQPHFDVKNHKWGFMTVHGDFTSGGGLFLPDLEMYLPLAPGDVIACLFQRVRHYVEHDFVGRTRFTGVHVIWDEVYRAWQANTELWKQLSSRGLRSTPLSAVGAVTPASLVPRGRIARPVIAEVEEEAEPMPGPSSSRGPSGTASMESGASQQRRGPIVATKPGATSARYR
jgi:hypothetical protein